MRAIRMDDIADAMDSGAVRMDDIADAILGRRKHPNAAAWIAWRVVCPKCGLTYFADKDCACERDCDHGAREGGQQQS